MVNFIDIHSLTVEELNGVIAMYPWYGAARMELCRRMSEIGALTDSQTAETAMYVGSRRVLYNLVHQDKKEDCTDKDIKILVNSLIDDRKEEEKKIYVVGGDYFSQSEYNEVRKSEDSVFSRFAAKAREEGFNYTVQEEEEHDFVTETIAKIYLEQDYADKAVDIYSKLILRYPEKSAYFAALIDEINKNR